MTDNEKAKEIAEKTIDDASTSFLGWINEMSIDFCKWSALKKDQNPSDEIIEKICKLCDMFDKDAPWQSACWCEHAEKDDWDSAYLRRTQFIKKHLKGKK